MRLAYIAMDRTAHKAHAVLERHYATVDFYLADSESKTINLDLQDLPTMAANVCIPADKSLRTIQHNLVQQEIKNEQAILFESIYSRKNITPETVEAIPTTSGNIKQISDIQFIQYNKTLNKFIFEISENEKIEYDFLIIQDNQFAMNQLLDKQRDLFVSFTEQFKVILNMDFEIKHSHDVEPKPADFIFVDNIYLKSIEDNWYICQMREDRFSVSVYIPLEMQNSSEYINFLAKRVAAVFNRSFEVFKIGGLITSTTVACDGFYFHRAKLRNSKIAALVPTFTFWSQPKINSYLSQMIKSKKNKNLTSMPKLEKENT